MTARSAPAQKATPAPAKPAKASRRRPLPARREAILAAALEEFSAQGFSAARLDDVARRAGVAKGTIYLYFRDKEALFEELIRSVLSPVVGAMELALRDERPVRQIADSAVEIFVREVYGTRRKDIIRLVISEGGRFPKLAEFYHREVLARLFAAMQALLRRAAEGGELRNNAVVQFPQLIGAPAIVGIIWSGLFDRFEPLDVRGFLRAQLDLIFVDPRRP
ncbi:MAG: TetR family transcriptional regulator [Rhizobiales bacterium]|nr:TetR family transcriptional regulator [Hyphomicrobiales bacterium]